MMGFFSPSASPRPSTRAERIRRQDSALILLNLAILAGIALVHALFAPAFGIPPRLFFVVLLGRFSMQVVELSWLRSTAARRAPRWVLAYGHASIWMNLGFAVLLARLAGFEDSHYVVLMIVPVVAAAFRYRVTGSALVVAAAGAATLGEVWLYLRSHPAGRTSEYFEAASVVLVYVVVAWVVGLLARQLSSEHRSLERTIEALGEARDRLFEEEKLAAIGRLASAIAHEIRNPVAMIASSLALARRGGEGMLDRDELDAIVEQETARLERLSEDFLSYARQRPLEKSRESVAALLGYIAGLVQARAAGAGLALEIDAAPDLAVTVDRFQVEQALLNLLLNAIEAAPAGSAVLITARPVGGSSGSSPRLEVSIENAGAPIPPDVCGRIFEPFVTTKPTGSGLGLAIARKIVRAHDGELRLASNGPGRIRFSLELPGLETVAPEREEAVLAAHPGR